MSSGLKMIKCFGSAFKLKPGSLAISVSLFSTCLYLSPYLSVLVGMPLYRYLRAILPAVSLSLCAITSVSPFLSVPAIIPLSLYLSLHAIIFIYVSLPSTSPSQILQKKSPNCMKMCHYVCCLYLFMPLCLSFSPPISL